MKAKINDEIWTIYDDQILLESVEFIGKDSFLIEGHEHKIDPEYYYDDYNRTWWKSFDKAIKEMRKRYGKNIKLKKVKEGWYELDG